MIKKIIVQGQETNYSVSDDGKVFNDKTGKELKGTYNSNEYHRVQLTINGKPKSIMTHRLVAEAFCENPNNYDIVDHIDGNKYNNNAINLRWVTPTENGLNVKSRKSLTDIIFITDEEYKKYEWRIMKNIPKNYVINNKGQIINKDTGRYILGSERNGYRRVNLNGTTYSVHRLVWESFVGEIPIDKIIDHIDGNKSNNDLTNLRLATISENKKYADALGKGMQIAINEYDLNGNLIQHFNSIREAARSIGVTEAAIRGANQRKGTCASSFWLKDEDDIQDFLNRKELGRQDPRNKKVYQYDKNGNFIKEYSSISQTCKQLDIGIDTFRRRILDQDQLLQDYYFMTEKV